MEPRGNWAQMDGGGVGRGSYIEIAKELAIQMDNFLKQLLPVKRKTKQNNPLSQARES